MFTRFAIVSFFNGLGDTVLLLPVIRYLKKRHSFVLIVSHVNSKPLLTEFDNVYFLSMSNDIPEIQNIFPFHASELQGSLTYYDFNITDNAIKHWFREMYAPVIVYDYEGVQQSDRKNLYESENMFHKNFILADIHPFPENVKRAPFIPETHTGKYAPLLEGSKKIITVHTDTDPSKEWNVHSWITLLRCITTNFDGYEIILLGFPDSFLQQCGFNKAPDFYSCLEAIKSSTLFLGVDSVFAHVADSFGIEGIVIFGDVKYTDWLPSGNSMSYILSGKNSIKHIPVKLVLGHILTFLSSAQTADELLRTMYLRDYRLIEHAPADILSDYDLIKLILESCPYIYPYIDNGLKKEYELIKSAVSSFWYMISFVPEEYRSDEICLIALEQSGWALDFVNENIKNQRSIIEMAVAGKGDALEFVPKKYQCDRAIVLLAVRENGLALQYADQTLLEDDEILETALRNNPFAIEFATLQVRNTPKWRLLCHELNPDTTLIMEKINDYAL